MRGGDGNDLRVRAWLAHRECGTLRFLLSSPARCANGRCQWHAVIPLSFPKAEKRNGNTALSPKPTDATKRSQAEWSETDRLEPAGFRSGLAASTLNNRKLRSLMFARCHGGCGWAMRVWTDAEKQIACQKGLEVILCSFL